MKSIPRTLALSAPFVAAFTLAAVCSAGDPSLGAMIDASRSTLEPLTDAAITAVAGDGPAASMAPLPGGVDVAVNGGASAAPAGAPSRPADTSVWQALPAAKH